MQYNLIENKQLQKKPCAGTKVTLTSVSKSFAHREILKSIDLDIEAGEFIAIVGHSGCGKSTLLRVIANLEKQESGTVVCSSINSDRQDPEVRIMFQDSRLLPWKNVIQNVNLGLGRRDIHRSEKVLEQVGLLDRASEWPATLSGGQKQRVALARALVHKPDLLLLDEPLGALDALTRIEMQELIESLWQTFGFTSILVTHDVQEAVALADRVIILENGLVTLDQQIDLPRPRSRGSASFAALEDEILGRLIGGRAKQTIENARVTHSALPHTLKNNPTSKPANAAPLTKNRFHEYS